MELPQRVCLRDERSAPEGNSYSWELFPTVAASVWEQFPSNASRSGPSGPKMNAYFSNGQYRVRQNGITENQASLIVFGETPERNMESGTNDYGRIWERIIVGGAKSFVCFSNGTCVILMKPEGDLSHQALSGNWLLA